QALTEMQPLPGRMNPLRGINNCLLVDDTYDATPDSTEAALEWLRSVQDGTDSRTIFVMGDMDYLGQQTERGHRMIGQVAADIADVIITQGPQAALIARSAVDQGKDRRTVHLTYSLQDAIAVFGDRLALNENDIVLVKGGASARMEVVVKALLADQADAAQLIRQGEAWETAQASFQPSSLTWVEIDQGAIAHNVRRLRSML